MSYLVVLEHGPTSWGAYVPDLPGCYAVAASREAVESQRVRTPSSSPQVASTRRAATARGRIRSADCEHGDYDACADVSKRGQNVARQRNLERMRCEPSLNPDVEITARGPILELLRIGRELAQQSHEHP